MLSVLLAELVKPGPVTADGDYRTHRAGNN